MTRKQIINKIQENVSKINKLKQENIELDRQQIVICDKNQWYKEEEVEIIVSRRPLIKKKVVRGISFWYENFIDEGTGKYFPIERCQVVKENGEWVY